MNEPKVVYPTVPVTDPKFVYVPWWRTDVTITWRKFGWQPKKDQKREEAWSVKK